MNMEVARSKLSGSDLCDDEGAERTAEVTMSSEEVGGLRDAICALSLFLLSSVH